jgi:hypothetical protein
MVCLSYLDVGDSPARVRYAIRRIRSKIPDVKILACLWGLEGEEAAGEDARSNVRANLYASTLRQAVALCIEAARPTAAEPAAPSAEPAIRLARS